MENNEQFDRLIVKLGTGVLTAGTSRLSPRRMLEIVRQIVLLVENGKQIALVSSGAIAAGREQLNNPELGRNIPAKQMLAAVGQPRLMHTYADLFAIFGLDVAQVLLTKDDFRNRKRYLNARDTLESLLAHSVIPIINENDTVGTYEIKLGDNDNLSALVANLLDADLLVLLTDQPGLLTGDPRIDPDAELISHVDDINDEIWEAAGRENSPWGTGGMVTKLQAAQLATRSGTRVVIAKGSQPNVLIDLCGPGGSEIGTWFEPVSTHVESRKRWILSEKPVGTLRIDKGAARMLKKGGASLLPVGVVGVEGQFERGAIVSVVGPGGKEVSRGQVNYNSEDIERLSGLHSDGITDRLGYTYGDEVIHLDYLVLV